MTDTLLTVTQAAARLNLGAWQVRKYCREGRLPAQLIGKTFAIRESDLLAFTRRPAGRPKSPKSTP